MYEILREMFFGRLTLPFLAVMIYNEELYKEVHRIER